MPITDQDIDSLKVGDVISISGGIYCGRDVVLPKIVNLYLEEKLDYYNINLTGGLIFHTGVSVAGVGPTSSNKIEIENSIGPLSEAGVKIHLGKGALSKKTVEVLNKHNSIFAIIPPVTALLESNILKREVIAFAEEGMEAFHQLKVKGLTMIVAVAHGESIYGAKHE